MKHEALLISPLGVGAFTIGDNKKKTTEAAQDMKDYTFEQKAAFTAQTESQLAEINKDLDALAAKIGKSSATVKGEATPKLQAVREEVARLNTQLDEIKNATESTWDSVKAISEKSYNELKDGFNQVRQWVGDNIAP